MKNFSSKGFTLIELLVAITIFAGTIGVITSIALDMLQAEAIAASNQVALDNARFIVQRISKAIRVSQIKTESNSPDFEYLCIDHPRRGYIKYELTVDNRIKETLMNGDCSTVTTQWGYLDSDKITIDKLNFLIEGVDDVVDDDRQPKVTIILEITPPKAKQKTLPSLNFQTTLSQRGLESP